jgi:hypothetical protein
MTEQKLTYPEFKPRPWALAMAWSLIRIEAELKKGLTGSPDTPRYKSFADTLAAVHLLAHERDVREFRGDKVHKLLVKAAQTHGWLAPAGKKRPLPKSLNPDNKVCKACYEEKHLSVFRTLATVAQKKRMGRNPDAQHYVTSNLCDVCRLSLARRTKRKAGKRMAPTLVSALKASITTSLETVAKVLKKNLAFIDADGDRISKMDDDSLAYYLDRRALLHKARSRLDAYIEDGTLAQKMKDIPVAEAMWHHLLTDDERAQLKAQHARGQWMEPGYRSRIPLLWEKSGTKGRKGFFLVVDEPDTTPTPPDTPPDTPPTQPAPETTDNWWDNP